LRDLLTAIFQDDAAAVAWIDKQFRDWSWATVGQDLDGLLRIYNGWHSRPAVTKQCHLPIFDR
jgi:hypothetical protein